MCYGLLFKSVCFKAAGQENQYLSAAIMVIIDIMHYVQVAGNKDLRNSS